jgi:PEP-CTERM motif
MTPPTGQCLWRIRFSGRIGVGTFTLTAVPEASTWALMLIGFAGLGIAGYRASQNRAASLGLAFGKDGAGAVRLILRF